MKCAFIDCINPELEITDPCSVCKRGVHHLCSNDLYDPDRLSVRPKCADEWKVKNLPLAKADGQQVVFETVGWSPEPFNAPDAGQPSSQSSVETLPPGSRTPVDSYGIPIDVHHYRQLGKRDNVWDVAHILAKAYPIGDNDDSERFTHVCLVCAANATSQPNAAADAWESGLHRWSNTSNAKDHMVAIHSTHPIGKAEKDKRVKRARSQIDSALQNVPECLSQRISLPSPQAPSRANRGALQKLWCAPQKELDVHIARWLINDGLPFNAVMTEDFRKLIHRATGNPDATILSAKTYNTFLEAAFGRFCSMTKRLLTDEFKAAYNLPFLNLLHDSCTTGSGKKGIVGSSVSFIDKNGHFRELALLVTIYNSSHESVKIKNMITSRVDKIYGVAIEPMTQFTMSDTTPSARKVSKLFEDSVPSDCAMHVLNLCLLYGMGMRENTETVHVFDPETQMQKKERRICTLGGPFPEGAALIKKVRCLNNYFHTPQRVERLKKVQQYYGLPELSPIVDCDTRVASSVTVFQRTIVNYPAFRAYFQQCETYDDPKMFIKPSAADWRLLVEVEAVTESLADLARLEVQRSKQVASEVLVVLKSAIERLGVENYLAYDLDALRTPKTNERSLPRLPISSSAFSAEGRICINRIKYQVSQRLPSLTAESVIVLLLDPRTKASVSRLTLPAADAGDVEADAVIEEGKTLLRNAHREVFSAMHTAGSDDSPSMNDDTTPNLDLVPCEDDELVVCGVPLSLTPARNVSASSLHDQADQVLDRWLKYTVQWVQVAVQQAPVDKLTVQDFTRRLLIRRNGEVCWRLQALCKHVDVRRWFSETGEVEFPSIAALARVWLSRNASNAFQERVFSTGSLIMSSRRTSTDNHRAEIQVLMKHNRAEIGRMESEQMAIFNWVDHTLAA